MGGQLIGGPIGNWLAIVGVISLLYWAWRIVMVLQSRVRAGPVMAAQPVAQAVEQDDDIVVIAAAVFAVTNARRVVQITPVSPNQNWVSEGRWAQQSSHSPRS
jgi:hypothetical protein